MTGEWEPTALKPPVVKKVRPKTPAPALAMACFLCASEAEITESTMGRSWRCECGRTHGVQLNEGALDVGITPPVDPASP
jgi:hypothetical protein